MCGVMLSVIVSGAGTGSDVCFLAAAIVAGLAALVELSPNVARWALPLLAVAVCLVAVGLLVV